MLIVSDTSPLTALLLCHRQELLRQMFGRVIIPEAVEKELRCLHPSLPEWIEVASPSVLPLSVASAGLDPGETEAIALALELRPDTLLIDERNGRRVAADHGLHVTGLLGLFVLAKKTGFVKSVAPLIREAQVKGRCWFGEALLKAVCESADESWP